MKMGPGTGDQGPVGAAMPHLAVRVERAAVCVRIVEMESGVSGLVKGSLCPVPGPRSPVPEFLS
jgi:hypothetical protein